MNPKSAALLQRVIFLGGRSLLQYLSESSPWLTAESENEYAVIVHLAQEEAAAVGKITRYLQKRHEERVLAGSYPAHFTTMNFLAVDNLVPRLIAENEKTLTDLKPLAAAAPDEEVRGILQAYLDMKQRHLHALRELPTTSERAAS